jgi:hypothetical protein
MSEKMIRKYIDTESFENVTSVFIGAEDGEPQPEVIYAGKSFCPAPVSERSEPAYQILAKEYDIHFIFEDNVPVLRFYPVPQLLIFAKDSFGGYFVSTNNAMDLAEKNAPIFYIAKNLEARYLSSNLREFLELVVCNPLRKENLHLPFSDTRPVPGQGREYLIRAFNLRGGNASSDGKEPCADAITIYASFEEAERNLEFFRLDHVERALKEGESGGNSPCSNA